MPPAGPSIRKLKHCKVTGPRMLWCVSVPAGTGQGTAVLLSFCPSVPSSLHLACPRSPHPPGMSVGAVTPVLLPLAQPRRAACLRFPKRGSLLLMS